MKKKNRNCTCPLIVMGFLIILINSCKKDDSNNPAATITDKDGNVYTSVTIGTQVWMKENLKTTKYNDGTPIPKIVGTYFSAAGYIWYNNDENSYKTTSGALYNFLAVQTGKLAPTGWHVPSFAEWTTLIQFLGGNSEAGGKLKEVGFIHWTSPNTGATNSSGFTALPGGEYDVNGNFLFLGQEGRWWFSQQTPVQDFVSYIKMLNDDKNITSTSNYTGVGMSVRCIKD
jgi:uncharacterized protein (TIGR02145 family)